MAQLTQPDLNRTLLARQHLLERTDRPLPRVVEDMGLLQAQYAPSMYIGLWSRTHGLERAHLDAALLDRTIVQGTSLRGTIHLHSREDYWPTWIAIRDPLRTWWARVSDPGNLGDMERAAARVRRAFEASSDGTLHRSDFDAVVGGHRGLMLGIHYWVELVRVPPSGTWSRRRADRYALASDWVGPEPVMTELAARALLARRYLAAFGPAKPSELRAWAGFVRVGQAKEALAELDLAEHVGPDGKAVLDLADGEIVPGETKAPPRFLPTWDASLLAHARRTAVLPETHRQRVFNTHTPQSMPTFLVGGEVAGAWRWTDDEVALEWFGPTERNAALERERTGLADLHR